MPTILRHLKKKTNDDEADEDDSGGRIKHKGSISLKAPPTPNCNAPALIIESIR